MFLGLRFALLAVIVGYFLLFVSQNAGHVTVALPFIKTFETVPMFLVIIVSIVVGITFQFLTSGFGRKNVKK